ncbi:phage portal protein [Mycolicibacterium sp. S2-37]|uniref:phage portal protein n=1 Tax=Mycolicibacterium sp. S2-37 TaxID=2810297 RepID=UPI001A941D96|nr:phage portal protein [Mycolicibacterium sp. S2-37]MBO0676800.1 phage portal protein [Mycolicibacterium sp. S2-37]
MSFLSRAFTRGATESRTLTGLASIPTPLEDAAMYGEAASGGAMTIGAFYACVSLLADSIASLNVSSFRWKDGAKTLVDPQPVLFQSSPYPGLTWFEWLWMLMESLAVTGNAFGHIATRGKDNRPTAIMPIHPDNITITLDPDSVWPDPVYRIKGRPVPRQDILHIKRFPIANQAWGMSPIQKMASSIGLSLAAERYGYRYFKDSANPSGILSTETDLTVDQQKRNMKQWILSHQNRRLPAMLTGGLKWQPVSITPEESQFLQTRQFQKSDIAMWFRVPPHMIGDTEKSTSWGTGIEEQTIGFVTYTLRPWLTCFEQWLSMLIPNGQTAKFNIDGLLRGDVKTRWEAYRLGRDSGVYSVNDIREMEDLPPVEDGDGRLQPMNFVPLGTDPAEVQIALAEKQAEIASDQAQQQAELQSQLNTAPSTGEGGNNQ